MGGQTLMRLRGLEGAFLGNEIDLLYPFRMSRPRLLLAEGPVDFGPLFHGNGK